MYLQFLFGVTIRNISMKNSYKQLFDKKYALSGWYNTSDE